MKNHMILITKEEAQWLETKGAKYGSDLHRTIGVAKKHYLTEESKWTRMLNNRRKAKILETRK